MIERVEIGLNTTQLSNAFIRSGVNGSAFFLVLTIKESEGFT